MKEKKKRFKHEHGSSFSVDYYAYASHMRSWNAGFKVLFSIISLLICIACNNLFVSLAVIFFMGFLTVAVGGLDLHHYITVSYTHLSFKGPKATPAKKTTNTSKKPVKMVTGVSLKVKKKKINIRFKLVSNVSKYQIMYSTKKSFKNKKVVTVRSGNVTIKKLKRKKTYFIRVRAISKNGKAGAWSVVKKVRVK